MLCSYDKPMPRRSDRSLEGQNRGYFWVVVQHEWSRGRADLRRDGRQSWAIAFSAGQGTTLLSTKTLSGYEDGSRSISSLLYGRSNLASCGVYILSACCCGERKLTTVSPPLTEKETRCLQGDNKERYVFFSFPHIAIDAQGKIGNISRPGRPGASSACGALKGALAEISANGIAANESQAGCRSQC